MYTNSRANSTQFRSYSDKSHSNTSGRLHTDEYYNKRSRKNKRHHQFRQKLYLVIITLFLVFSIGIIFGSMMSKAESLDNKSSDTYKYYKSITIESGDTLWCIAKDNITSEYDSIEQYINEIVFINCLDSYDIHAGASLTIPYYSSEFVY